jgi:hypothetical protein
MAGRAIRRRIIVPPWTARSLVAPHQRFREADRSIHDCLVLIRRTAAAAGAAWRGWAGMLTNRPDDVPGTVAG